MSLDKIISMDPDELIQFSNAIHQIMNDFIEKVTQYATQLQQINIYEEGAAKKTMEAYFQALSKTTELMVHYQALEAMLKEIREKMQEQDQKLATQFDLNIKTYNWMKE